MSATSSHCTASCRFADFSAPKLAERSDNQRVAAEITKPMRNLPTAGRSPRRRSQSSLNHGPAWFLPAHPIEDACIVKLRGWDPLRGRKRGRAKKSQDLLDPLIRGNEFLAKTRLLGKEFISLLQHLRISFLGVLAENLLGQLGIIVPATDSFFESPQEPHP